MSKSVWTCEETGQSALLACGPLRAKAIVYEKGGFLSLDEWNGQKTRFTLVDDDLGEVDVSLLQFLAYAGTHFRSESLGLAEVHARGCDLVASYDESGEQRVAPEIYWRATYVERFSATRIELIVSIRTGLLDSEPASRVQTSITNAEAQIYHAAALDATRFEASRGIGPSAALYVDGSKSLEHLFVIRVPHLGFSYAEMVHPTDFVSAEATVDEDRASLAIQLFPERLEKGVIRRGRVCGWFMPVENDLETAVKLAWEFVEEPLPLTA